MYISGYCPSNIQPFGSITSDHQTPAFTAFRQRGVAQATPCSVVPAQLAEYPIQANALLGTRRCAYRNIQGNQFCQQQPVLLQLYPVARAHLILDFRNTNANLEGLRNKLLLHFVTIYIHFEGLLLPAVLMVEFPIFWIILLRLLLLHSRWYLRSAHLGWNVLLGRLLHVRVLSECVRWLT